MPPESGSEVDLWFDDLEHPLTDAALRLRTAILGVSPSIVESIKWKAPNFATTDDFATFSLRRPNAVQVILHTGAKPKPEHPEIVIDDPAGLAKRLDRNRFVVTITSDQQAAVAEPAFITLVRSWVDQLD
ncbi:MULTISPECIES: DUF1801 domain-containing protein [unclassified Leifsonia]|uniref:DUF1801 domain-containing protein n=1 Tax=unclassified Leifsonia TaxID=2663824 RepID=UPI0006FFA0BF|nr:MULTISPECIES: DUF1801 domain-containing protein [unclassified Leifsonia]KQX05067.1 hypothetical protein ASC59_12645 [Leifsonia sp. Root1293]KRA08699.1 hypothetical protein ASD61_12645 [Leifsonia sp. Root60]